MTNIDILEPKNARSGLAAIRVYHFVPRNKRPDAMRSNEGHIQESSAWRLIHGLALYPKVVRENLAEMLLAPFKHIPISAIQNHV